jgi:hypothetical protein
MNGFSVWHWRGAFLASLGCVLALAAGSLLGQKPAPRIGSAPELLNLDRDWDKDAKEEAKEFDALRRGEEPVTEDKKALLDAGAKWFAYRLTHPQYQEPSATNKTMHDLVKQAMAQIIDPRAARTPPTANQQAFMDEFGKRFVARLEEVSKNRKEIARVNATMLLAHLAATGVEEAVDVLVDIIRDPNENEGVKLFAFRGLKELFAQGRAEDQNPFNRKKDREAACIAALLEYLARKLALRSGASPQEIAAINYVRSEAVAALGQTRLPAVSRTVAKKTVIERPTALALLREVRHSEVPIPPSLGEQVNAFVGLCQLKSVRCDEYQPDYAAYHLGQFVAEFVNRFVQDQPEKVVKTDKTGKEQEKVLSRESWKIYAARMHQALEELKADTERNAEAKYIAKLVNAAQQALVDVVSDRKSGPGALVTYLEQNPPKNTTLYKDLITAKITSEPEKSDQ